MFQELKSEPTPTDVLRVMGAFVICLSATLPPRVPTAIAAQLREMARKMRADGETTVATACTNLADALVAPHGGQRGEH